MRKHNIQPGVVYAFRDGQGEDAPLEPVMFLSAPADGVLYQDRGYEHALDHEMFHVAEAGAKPGRQGRGLWAVTTGHAAVFAWKVASIPALQQATVDDFEQATLPQDAPDGCYFALITRLGQVVGPWDEAVAARKQRQLAAKARA